MSKVTAEVNCRPATMSNTTHAPRSPPLTSWFSSAGLNSRSHASGMICESPRRNATAIGAVALFSLWSATARM